MAASGITGVARTTGAALSPLFAGLLFATPTLMSVPFYIAGALKIAYDLSLFRGFRSLKPREEVARTGAALLLVLAAAHSVFAQNGPAGAGEGPAPHRGSFGISMREVHDVGGLQAATLEPGRVCTKTPSLAAETRVAKRTGEAHD